MRLKSIEEKMDFFLRSFENIKPVIEEAKFIVDVTISTDYANYLLSKIVALKVEKKVLLDKIEKQKAKIARLNGEKKAVEKYLRKKEKEKIKQELLQEGRLADEVFNRRFAGDDDFAK